MFGSGCSLKVSECTKKKVCLREEKKKCTDAIDAEYFSCVRKNER